MMSVRVAGVSLYSHGEDVAQGSMKTQSARKNKRTHYILYIVSVSSVCLSVYIYSICQLMYPTASVCLSINLSVYVYRSLCVSIHPSFKLTCNISVSQAMSVCHSNGSRTVGITADGFIDDKKSMCGDG